MTEHIALVGSGTGGTVLANTLAEKFRSEIDAGEDETRRAIQVPLRALGGADTNGPVGRRDLWEGLRDGEFPLSIRYVLSVGPSLGRAVQTH